jgi:hypothetical protein
MKVNLGLILWAATIAASEFAHEFGLDRFKVGLSVAVRGCAWIPNVENNAPESLAPRIAVIPMCTIGGPTRP